MGKSKHTKMCAPKYRVKPPRYGVIWEPWEVKLICVSITKGKSVQHMATTLGRTEGTIITEFCKAANCNPGLLKTRYAKNIYHRGSSMFDSIARTVRGRKLPRKKTHCRWGTS